MSNEQPLLQIGTPLRDRDPGYVIVRLDTDEDVEAAVGMINRANEVLAPLVVGLADTVSRLLQDGTAGVTGQLQAAGLNPVPMAAPQASYPAPQTQAAPTQVVYQPQAQASQQYQQQVAQAPAAPVATTPLVGPCWAASDRKMHNSECQDCHQPTFLTIKNLRNGKTVNAHVCSVNPGHKVTWCENLIWNSKVVAANGRGIITDPNLVTG